MYLGTTNPGYATLIDIYKRKKAKPDEPQEISIQGVAGVVLAAEENVKIGE